MTTYAIAESGGDFTTLEAFVEDAGTLDGDVGEVEGTWTTRENTRIAVADALTLRSVGSSKHPGRAWKTGDTHFQHRSTSSGHSFTITDTGAFTIEDMDVQLGHTGVSDEIFRNNVANTFVARRCVLGFDSRTDQQDLFYTETTTDATFEQCHFYNVYRGCLDLTGSASGTVNINSCTAYDIGFSTSQTSRSGLVGKNTSGTMTINIYNTIVHMNTVSYPVCTNSTASNTTGNIERLITNSTVVPMQNAPATENYANNVEDAVINDTDSSGNYILLDTTTSPYDLRLFDNATNNAAQDVHATATAANLTIPSTDMLGTSRPQNTNFDLGAFEVAVAGDTEVNATSDTLVITEQAASIKADIEIAATTDTLVITEFSATVGLGTNINATSDSLVLTPFSATIKKDIEVSATTDSLLLTTFTADIGTGSAVNATTDVLGITTFNAGIVASTDVQATVDSLVITEFNATVSTGVIISAGTDTLVITEQAATIVTDINVNASSDSLTITEFPALVVNAIPDYLIDGVTSKVIVSNFGAIKIYGNGENWFTI